MKLYYFKEDEFIRGDINWYSRISPSLLVKLDVLRHIWGSPIIISPSPQAIGRYEGTSQHNINKWGEVRAVER